MNIEVDEGALSRRSRGPDLYFASAQPSEGMRAMLGVVHGYADHGARYRHVMGALAEHGIGSVAIDMRGHGRALGPRGYCERFDEFLDDARDLRRLVSERAKGAPTFLFGHSFGGLVAFASVVEDPGDLCGLLLSAPFFGLGLEPPALKVAAGKIASRVFPRLALPTGLSGKQMSHDPAKVREYDEDPLVFGNATARWFTETVSAQERMLAAAPKLALPLFLSFGTTDPVASIAAARRVFDAAGSKDKTFDARDGLFHEILNEASWKDLVDLMAKWILVRLG